MEDISETLQLQLQPIHSANPEAGSKKEPTIPKESINNGYGEIIGQNDEDRKKDEFSLDSKTKPSTGGGETVLIKEYPQEISTFENLIEDFQDILNPSVEQPVQDFFYEEILIAQLKTAETDSSSGSSVDAQTDSETSDDEFQTYKIPNHVYKFDDQFKEFIEEFTSTIDWKSKLVINRDTLFNEDLFPQDMVLTEYIPTIVDCPYLKKLYLLVPQTLDYLTHTNCEAFVRQVLGVQSLASEKEGIVRDQILFILQSIRAKNLESFVFENVDHGMHISSQDRQSVLEDKLRKFLRNHSATLKKIDLKTVRVVGGIDARSHQNWSLKDFPKLEELSLVFWDKSLIIPDEPSAENTDPSVQNYWVHLLKTRASQGNLRMLVWISSESLAWEEIISPVILRNKATLEKLHIICIGDQSKPKETNIDRVIILVAPTPISKSDVVRSCSQFSDMYKLKSLYLGKPHFFLTQLSLLPPQLEELCLDFIYLASYDLTQGIQKLEQLRKIRLVENVPNWAKLKNGKVMKNYGQEEYGVNENVIRAILHHRKLNDVCIWGYTADLEVPLFDSSKERTSLEENPAISMSMFQKFRGFFKKFYCKSSRAANLSNGVKNDFQPTLLSVLNEIALVQKDCIIFGQEDNDLSD